MDPMTKYEVAVYNEQVARLRAAVGMQQNESNVEILVLLWLEQREALQELLDQEFEKNVPKWGEEA